MSSLRVATLDSRGDTIKLGDIVYYAIKSRGVIGEGVVTKIHTDKVTVHRYTSSMYFESRPLVVYRSRIIKKEVINVEK